ncbi:hypothetical protein [Streptomyces sp. NPDC005525]|uniref:hypothetical protein n=1 Tax=Streptomyces sp. NPDC005525 TaxID=3364720 RepID=UPI00368A28F5
MFAKVRCWPSSCEPLAKAGDLLIVPTTMPGELVDMVRSYQAGTWTCQYVGHTL